MSNQEQTEWFLLYNNQYHLGPFDSKAINYKLSVGELETGDLIWCDSMKDWESVNDAFIKKYSQLTSPDSFKTKSFLPHNKSELSINSNLTSNLSKSIQNEENLKSPRKQEIDWIDFSNVIPPLPKDEIDCIEKPLLSFEEIKELDIKSDHDCDKNRHNQEVPPLPTELQQKMLSSHLNEKENEKEKEDEREQDRFIQNKTDLKLKKMNVKIKKAKKIKKVKIHYRLAIILIILFCFPLLFIFTNIFDQTAFHNSISKGKRFYLTTFNDHNIVEFKALLSTRKNLFVSTNRMKNGVAQLTFRSVKGKIISEQPILFKTKVHFKQNIGIVRKLTFEEGQKFAPGYYFVTFSTIQESLKDKILNIFSKYPLIFKTKILLNRGTQKQFNKKLISFKNKKLKQYVDPLQNKLILISTLKSLVENFKNKLKHSLNFSKRGYQKKRRIFLKSYYNRKIGPMLTTLVVKNYKSKDRVIFENIIETGKKFGALSVEIITETNNRFFRSRILFFIVRLNSIKKSLVKSEEKIKEKILYYSNNFKK